ncbi:unnamed protein product [Mesocestoides corti]|uniref:Chorein_N domain-containing protein n=1 Tax=Mesocestoides corti TaxID=53468 RepID=A0A0R3UGL3_MESCO|nr:unnamed protein product [Mesocestoides corti]
MPSIIKQQILRPLSKFGKNIDPNQITMSALKGEVNMANLELNEDVLMEVLNFPTWLRIRSAVCTQISIKLLSGVLILVNLLIPLIVTINVVLSYVTLSSKKPNWNPGPLHFTFIQLPEKNSVLIFKEISWESTRFEADGLAAHMTPVKVITNHANLRVVLKKRLSGNYLC